MLNRIAQRNTDGNREWRKPLGGISKLQNAPPSSREGGRKAEISSLSMYANARNSSTFDSSSANRALGARGRLVSNPAARGADAGAYGAGAPLLVTPGKWLNSLPVCAPPYILNDNDPLLDLGPMIESTPISCPAMRLKDVTAETMSVSLLCIVLGKLPRVHAAHASNRMYMYTVADHSASAVLRVQHEALDTWLHEGGTLQDFHHDVGGSNPDSGGSPSSLMAAAGGMFSDSDDLSSFIRPGDVLRVEPARSLNTRGQLIVVPTRKGRIFKVGEYDLPFVTTPNISGCSH
eukprot:GHVU01102382.1.p1 GENE.GHVU01102382.1~~GHVU01102382.1.p1  ORF type:complete len:291 (+),score=30.12 GHVU01102382.1:453-1325(+)